MTSCQLCVKNWANYTCPKCNIGYCSVTCYRSEYHKNCSEQFYQTQVHDYLGDAECPDADGDYLAKMMTDRLSMVDSESDRASVSTNASMPENGNPKSSKNGKPTLQQMLQSLTPEQIQTFISSEAPWWEKAVNELPLQLNLQVFIKKGQIGNRFESKNFIIFL